MTTFVLRAKACALLLGLLGATAADAQGPGGAGSVTLYGIIDACLARPDLGANKLELLSSGCLSGSRWGLRGVEDLGGGLRAGFLLESGMTIDNGQLAQGGRLFGRKALVYLGGRWGAVELGRDYAPAFYLIQPIDPMALGIGTASSTIWTGSASTTAGRNDNVINVLSPGLAGWSARVQVAAGEGGTNNARKAMGANVLYRGGGTIAGVSHTRVANAADTADDRATTVGVRQDVGVFSLAALAQFGGWKGSQTVAAPASATSIFSRDYRSYLVGGSVRIGHIGFVNASRKRYDDRTRPNFDADQASVNFIYPLSKRTDLYVGYSRLENKAASRYSVADATQSYMPVDSGATTSLLAAGIRHLF